MRIWDVPVRELCDKHLLGEHRELHGLWNIITQGKKGYSNHPETKRWVGRTRALWRRHNAQVYELERRAKAKGKEHEHKSWPMLPPYLGGPTRNNKRLATLDEQREILRGKPCKCYTKEAD